MILAAATLIAHCIGCSFAGANFQNRDLRDVSWVGANLRGANLRSANLSGSRIAGVDMTGADLTAADFSDSRIVGANFRRARFDGAKFTGARFAGANFRDAILQGVASDQLRDLLGHCPGCAFENTDLHGKDLRGVQLVGDSFRNADLRNVDLSGAALCWRNTRDSTDPEVNCSDLSGADLHGANLRGVQVCDERGGDRRCSAVDAQTLRDKAHASLSGASLSL